MTESLRFHIYGNEHDHILNLHKSEWQGRFYKNLHGKGQGWSFPIHMKDVIQESISLPTNKNENHKETTQSESISVSSQSTISSIPSHNDYVANSTTNHVQGKCREYKWDIPSEVYKYFQDILHI